MNVLRNTASCMVGCFLCLLVVIHVEFVLWCTIASGLCTVLSLIQEIPLSCQGTLGILTFLIKFIYLAIWAIQGYPRDLSYVQAFRVFSEFLYGS